MCIIHKRLYTYLESNALLCREQSGFRRNHGTHDPIIDLIGFINKRFNEGKYVVCIFVDLAKAFNSLDCRILVEKLSRLGIRDNILKLLADYLADRKQSVNLNGIISVLEHGLFTLDGHYTNQVTKLQKLQNKALRLCFKKDNMYPSYPLHTKAKLLALDLHRKYQLLNFMNTKLIKDHTFRIDQRKDNRTRGGSRLEVHFPHSERFKKSLSYFGPKLCNDLPPECKQITCLNSLRRALSPTTT